MSPIEWFAVAVIGLVVVAIVCFSIFKTRKQKAHAEAQQGDRTQETQIMTGRPEAPANNP